MAAVGRRKRAGPAVHIVPSAEPSRAAPARVARRFLELIEQGSKLRPAGRARGNPRLLLRRRYLPRYEVALFDTRFFLTDCRFDSALTFFVGYVLQRESAGARARPIFPRIFYKDLSLVWRVASHFVHDAEEYWIGKGDVHREERADGEYLCSAEETTNLPYELQAAFDALSARGRRRRDERAVELIVREAPSGRIAPYADFSAPRARAAARGRIHGGRKVAWFERPLDPASLRFARGFEPDLERGVLETARSYSKFFGGTVRKFRVLSANRAIQYQFVAVHERVWINPPQALTSELSSYGVRVDDVAADERAFLPGFEYHDVDGDGDAEPARSQIPSGFAGAAHPDDEARADASAWLEALPPVREFRRKVLRSPAPRRRRGWNGSAACG